MFLWPNLKVSLNLHNKNGHLVCVFGVNVYFNFLKVFHSSSENSENLTKFQQEASLVALIWSINFRPVFQSGGPSYKVFRCFLWDVGILDEPLSHWINYLSRNFTQETTNQQQILCLNSFPVWSLLMDKLSNSLQTTIEFCVNVYDKFSVK